MNWTKFVIGYVVSLILYGYVVFHLYVMFSLDDITCFVRMTVSICIENASIVYRIIVYVLKSKSLSVPKSHETECDLYRGKYTVATKQPGRRPAA